jgi:hypothetical protein
MSYIEIYATQRNKTYHIFIYEFWQVYLYATNIPSKNIEYIHQRKTSFIVTFCQPFLLTYSIYTDMIAMIKVEVLELCSCEII